MRTPRAALAVVFALLGACAGWPPKQKAVQLPEAAPLDSLSTESGGNWPAQDWWKRYQDSTLDQLIELGGANSPSLATAHARYDSARQSVRLAAAESGAHLDASADADRQRISEHGLFPPQLLGFTWYNQFDLGLQASYTFDWWGKQRAAVEAAMDQAHAAQADRSAAALMLASSIADAYFGWQSDQNRLLLAREKEAAVEAQARVSGARVRADLDSEDELDSAELALAAAREQVAYLQGSAELRVVALAALVGRPISDLPPLSPRPLPSFPAILPDNVKIDLMSRRADITASRWRVEAAQRSLASARADFFPDVTVNALLGLNSLDVGKLLEYGSRVPQVSAAIHLPIFDAGRLKARYGGAQAAIDAAVSNYQDTVISAARDVATQATTRAQIEAQRSQRLRQVEAALRMKSTAAARVRQGLTDSRSELTATESWIDQRDGLMQLDSAALSADIALQRALGGGYESPQKIARSSSTIATP
ncbi:MAG TPA: efflux transporter outer membrane subunit [Steroidobacteraceae bacterium]|nr:efflux transporter outer membrane subunit [Steroidobacteraceae bacterium]